MRICARAPLRVDPAGGGTDCPPFSVEHGGAVLNFCVNRHAYASAEYLPPGQGIVIYSADLQAGVSAESADILSLDDPLAFLKAFVRRLVSPGDSLLLVTESDAPPGSGLGGSGALGVAIVAALDRLYGRERSPCATALVANDVERVDLGFPGGSQDSLGPALGGVNLLEYPKDGEVAPHKVELSDETRLDLEHHSLLIYTGAAHVSGSIHEDIKRSYALEDSPTVKAMVNLRAEARTMATALASGDLDGYARSLNESCANLYALHESCASEEHRRYFVELKDLIRGGKTCGAGGGGFLLVFTTPGCRSQCVRRAEQMGGTVWPVTLDVRGVVTWESAPMPTEALEHYMKRMEVRA